MRVTTVFWRGWGRAAIALVLLAPTGCQPTTLSEEKVTGVDAGSVADTDAAVGDATVQADQDGSADQLDQQAIDAIQEVLDTAECQSDGDCTAKAPVCHSASCAAGKCLFAKLKAAAACDDGDPCTLNDACDGAAKCTAGAKPLACDDGNPCTVDSCEAKVGCSHAAKGAGACDDGDPCSTNDTCKDGACSPGVKVCQCKENADCDQFNVCVGPQKCDTASFPYVCKATTAINKCPDTNPNDCIVTTCNPAAPLNPCVTTVQPDNAACSDGIVCTTPDVCVAGVCKAGSTATCECTKDADCIKPGLNLCSAPPYCDVAEGYKCKVKPPISCDPSADTACIVNTCNSTTGKCEMKPIKKDPLPCDDNNGCTVAETCEVTDDNVYTGKCVPSANVCACTKTADCAAQEDGNKCNGTLFCNKVIGVCQVNPATVVKCPTGLDTACLKTLCSPTSGICETLPTERLKTVCDLDKPNCGAYVKLADNEPSLTKPCDDGNPCTATSSCQSGQCATEKTSFTCGCQQDSDCAKLGDACSGTFYCDKGSGKCELNPATVKICPTVGNTQCAKNICNPVTGACVMTPVDKGTGYVACEDGNPCTVFDSCEKGQCVSGTNTCKCQADSDCAAVDDGDVCNGTNYCNKVTGACLTNPATIVYCTPAFDTPCVQNKCQPATGKCEMIAKNDTASCDDGNICTKGDICVSGACVSGTDTCTCKSNADCGKFEDGDLCNGTLYCDFTGPSFECKVNPATKVSCPGGQATICLKNSCNKLTGKCALEANPQLYAPCDDGNACTMGDICIGGACVSGTNMCQCIVDGDCTQYDDGNFCNGILACIGASGSKMCAVNPATVTSCPGGGGDCSKYVCDPQSGKCSLAEVADACNDANPCTTDACVGPSCTHDKLADKTPCGSGAKTKTCQNGQCVAN